jgi:hypothetical protein
MLRITKLIALVSCLLLSACAKDMFAIAAPPPGARCDFVRYRLDAEAPRGASSSEQSVREAILARSGDGSGGLPKMLFMSGGSQHGAFGAGLLDEWRIRAGANFPRFKVVTGISTGSILATFAFTGDTEMLVGRDGYGITKESQLLIPYLDNRDGLTTVLSFPRVLKKGAAADLAPLRAQLLRVLDDRILHKVAEGEREGRLLMVGAVDVDTARAVAFDLTNMAARIDGERNAVRREQLRGCYADAILASSSAPLAARPVFIDRVMYVDGGARFGVFSDDVGSPIRPAGEIGVAAVPTAKLYVIVNGTLGIKPRCPTDKCDSRGRPDPKMNHSKWSLPDLGLRSVDILEHQVYALSVERIIRRADEGHEYRAAQIRPAADKHLYTMPPELSALGTGTKTCEEWSDVDDVDHPLQFHPRYMHCLIDYGRARMRGDLKWDAT